MAYKESLSMLIILIIFMLASFLNGYTPEYVQLWSLGGQTVLSGIPHSFLNDYAKFSNPPRVYFATINGFVLTGLNLIDIKLQPTFYSTYLKIDAYRKTGSTLSWLDFGVIMTNDSKSLVLVTFSWSRIGKLLSAQ